MTKILVIDDDDLVRNMVCNALKKENFEVLEAANGNEGLEIMQSKSPDLIVTDILMPDKEGIETIMEIKSLDQSIKIIAMSGGGSSKNMTYLDIAKRAGAHSTLSKPFKASALLEAVHNALR